MTVVTTTATAPPPVSSMETGKGAAADEGDDGRGHRAAPAVLLLSFPRRRGRRLSFDGISRPSTTATVFPLTAVCVRLARDQNLGLVGQGGRGAFQFYEANDAVLEFPKYCSIIYEHKVRSHSRGGGGQISRKFCSWV